MLRLTLRTLLAYLDDTLEPAQAKDIGKKVAESDFAQETVERIKTVTRRRRLSAPPVEADDQSADPNTIAEYLDNVLPGEQVGELEQAALDNDMKLAEVAACHQILTLVLGEPAKVPPTARRRMYRLVTGPEAIPYRQPAAASAPVAGVAIPEAVDEFHDHDDDLLGTFLGPRKVLWIVGLTLAAGLLAISVWLAIPPAPPAPGPGYVAVLPTRPETTKTIVAPPVKKPEVVVEPKPEPVVPKPAAVEPEPGPPPREVGFAGPAVAPPAVREPDPERRPIAAYDAPLEPFLAQQRDTGRWARLDAGARVSTTDALLALPGFHPQLALDGGVRLELWGNVPDHLPLALSESRVTLHVPAQGLDADLTLHAGRVFITAPKADRPIIVRVRFRDEAWDVTLGTRDTEVGIDLIGEPARGVFDRDLVETPRALAYLGVVTGLASVRAGFVRSGDLGAGARWKWDSKGGRPGPAPKADPDEAGVPNRWVKVPPNTPAGKETAAAVTEMARRIGVGAGPFEPDFAATLKDPTESISRRVLATWMLAAVDGLAYLVDALEVDAPVVRDAAAKALQHWVAQDPSRANALNQVLAMKATLTDVQRARIAAFVRLPVPPVPADGMDQLFELLGADRLAIRELVRLQLARLDPAGAKESRYDAGSDQRGAQAQAWKDSWKRRAAKGK